MTTLRFILSVQLCLLATLLLAQSNLNFTMKTGVMAGKPDIDYQNGNFRSNESSSAPGNTISMAFSLPVKNKFRLGAELGFVSFKPYIDHRFNLENGGTESYRGYYNINQTYFAVVPEYRLFKMLYFQGGIGYFADFNSNFSSGYSTKLGNPGYQMEYVEGRSFARTKTTGYFIGAGFCPNLTNELSFLAEVRYLGSPANAKASERIQIGYHAVNISVGLMYKPIQ